MEKFWKYNVLLSILCFALYVITIFYSLKKDTDDLIPFIGSLLFLAIIQLIISVLVSVMYFKKQNIYSIVFIILQILILFIELLLIAFSAMYGMAQGEFRS